MKAGLWLGVTAPGSFFLARDSHLRGVSQADDASFFPGLISLLPGLFAQAGIAGECSFEAISSLTCGRAETSKEGLRTSGRS